MPSPLVVVAVTPFGSRGAEASGIADLELEAQATCRSLTDGLMVTYGGMKIAEPILAGDLEDEPRRASGIQCSTCLQLGNDTHYPVDALTVVRHWKVNSNPADLTGGGHWWWYCPYHASVSSAEWSNDRNAPVELHPAEWPGLVTVDGSSVVAQREDREGRGLTEFDIKKSESVCPNCFTVRAADGSCLCAGV